MRNRSRGAKNDCFQINMNRITGLSFLYSPHSASRCTLCFSFVILFISYISIVATKDFDTFYHFHNTGLSGYGQGLNCNPKLQSTGFEVEWTDGRGSQMTQTASSVLKGPARAKLEHRISSGLRRESVVGDGKLVSLPGNRKPWLVDLPERAGRSGANRVGNRQC